MHTSSTLWKKVLKYDPIPPLLSSGNPAVVYFVKRDLLGSSDKEPFALWDLPTPRKILRAQTSEGSWRFPTARARSATDYDLLETFRQLGFLIEMFGCTREHPGVVSAAEYVFSKQTSEGDIRGILGTQYMPYYAAALMELLIKAGYQDDPRIHQSFAWLASMRQADGGWALPIRTRGYNLDAINEIKPIEPDKNKPFSHLMTGIVLRAYAAHPQYRHSAVAEQAGNLLVSRFFQKDVYPDRNQVNNWTHFSFPFWMTDILSSLDSISQINPDLKNDNAKKALEWLIHRQQPSGLIDLPKLKDRYHDLNFWLSLATCRVLKRIKE